MLGRTNGIQEVSSTYGEKKAAYFLKLILLQFLNHDKRGTAPS